MEEKSEQKESEEEGGGGKKECKALNGTQVLSTQVGGHRFGMNGKKMGMLDRGNGIVLKALQTPPRGARELSLYEDTFAPACQNTDLLKLRQFLPHYYGTEIIDDVTFLVMNNIAHSFPKPNVLDLKMGLVTYDPEASPEKKHFEDTKYPPVKQLGFQLTGMMIQDPSTGSAKHFPKSYCRSVTAETMLTDGLGLFFGLENGRLRKDVLTVLLRKLCLIEQWFQEQRTYAFYASSLLIVFSSVCSESDSASSQDEVSASAMSTPYLSPSSNNDAVKGTGSVNGTACVEQNVSDSKSSDSTSDNNTASRQKRKLDKNEGDAAQTAADNKHRKTHHAERSIADSTGETNLSCEPRQHDLSNNMGTDAGPSEVDQTQDEPSHVNPSENFLPEKGKTIVTEIESSSVNDRISDSSHHKTDRHCERPVCQKGGSIVDVRMIDFAHVFPASGKDTNYLFGLQKLISFVEALLKM